MRAITQATMLLLAGFALSAASCGNRTGLASTPLPPAADLQVKPEPPIPDAAFEIDPATGEQTVAAKEAEDRWGDQVLLWGREGWQQVGRLCRWAAGHGSPVPCPASRQPERP